MYQYEMNDQYASDFFTLIRQEHVIESINDFSEYFLFRRNRPASVSDGLDLCRNQNALFQPIRPFLP